MEAVATAAASVRITRRISGGFAVRCIRWLCKTKFDGATTASDATKETGKRAGSTRRHSMLSVGG